jgi:potassium/chloride transporter 9
MPSSGRPQLRSPNRQHSNFKARAATDDAGELNRRYSNITEEQTSPQPTTSKEPHNPYEPATNSSTPPPRDHEFTKHLLHIPSHSDNGNSRSTSRRRSASGRRKSIPSATMGQESLTVQMHNEAESKKANGDSSAPRPGLGPRPVGGSEKLGMFSGVYVPTCLNVLSILMFLRFGFLLGLFATAGKRC